LTFALGAESYREVVAVAASHRVAERLPLDRELASPDVHHVHALRAVDRI